jgi:hypothetical protein
MSESYDLYDFTESLGNIDVADIEHVASAWGEQGDYAEWQGGFLMQMKDSRWCYITGWCDTSGWGCRDGREEFFFDHRPDYDELHAVASETPIDGWGDDPADLNKYIANPTHPSLL